MRLPRRLMTCTTMVRAGVGVIHLHEPRLGPASLGEVLFQPKGRDVYHVVPRAAWRQVLDSETFEQAMAIIRDCPKRSTH